MQRRRMFLQPANTTATAPGIYRVFPAAKADKTRRQSGGEESELQSSAPNRQQAACTASPLFRGGVRSGQGSTPTCGSTAPRTGLLGVLNDFLRRSEVEPFLSSV